MPADRTIAVAGGTSRNLTGNSARRFAGRPRQSHQQRLGMVGHPVEIVGGPMERRPRQTVPELIGTRAQLLVRGRFFSVEGRAARLNSYPRAEGYHSPVRLFPDPCVRMTTRSSEVRFV